ncbi:MAG: hypothetical protein WA830_21795 [Candidatus Sulfotelmatobacter sp.]
MIPALCLLTAWLTLPSLASAQANFTLTAAPFAPEAVAPGGVSSSNITVGAVNSFNGDVTLSCQVSPSNLTSPPACTVSPATVTAPASATATLTTTDLTSTVGYTVTITGTGTPGTQTTPALQLTVLAVTPQFTITVLKSVAPSSVPAGSGGQGTININPINGYSSPLDPNNPNGGVTLSCATITPLVTIAPVCSFNPPSPKVIGTVVTSTLTISTYGPVTTGSSTLPRSFYALWMPVPMLALVGLGAAVGGKRSRNAWGLLALFVISGAVFLMLSCATNNTTSTTTPNGVTPNNTYTLTVMGVDAEGVISSNTGSTTSTNPTVSLTVTAPTP